ncbi:unnamed protein product, partial [Porites lobata]
GQINVTLAVFSGRRDPQWFLLPSNSKFAQIKKLLDEARKSYLTYSPNMMPARLGFKGFLVQGLKQKEPELIIGKSTLALQQHLFGTLPAGRPCQTTKTTTSTKSTRTTETTGAKSHTIPPKKPISVTGRRKRYAYEITSYPWNDIPAAQLNNNCYNYANNKATYTFAQPGRGSGARCQYHLPDCMRNAAINDHLETLDLPPAAPLPPVPSGKKHLVALKLNYSPSSLGVDFHWYRLDQLGIWSHKPGTTQATIFDNGGAIIFDPRVANRGGYTTFACFMHSDRDEVTIA